jgi:hypothetical protein
LFFKLFLLFIYLFIYFLLPPPSKPRPPPLNFVVGTTDRLRVTVSLVSLVGLSGQPCWCYATTGMALLGQPEVVILLRSLQTDIGSPPDMIVLLLKRIRHLVRRGLRLEHGTCVSLEQETGQPPFLADPNITGLLFARYSVCLETPFSCS